MGRRQRAFTGFDADAFLAMLALQRAMPGCLFVAAPDVVGHAGATLRLFETWAPLIRTYGFPVALVAQDGLQTRDVPWDRLDALFIGGTTAWKLSASVDTLLAYASALGKWRHVGRVNTRRRMRHFWGRCDSIDGSGFSRFPKRIALALAWFTDLQQQPTLVSR
jgi:hypothetical protein